MSATLQPSSNQTAPPALMYIGLLLHTDAWHEAASSADRELRQLGVNLEWRPRPAFCSAKSPAAAAAAASRCFGQQLSEQPAVSAEGVGPVPSVLATCCKFLTAGHLNCEGLFRLEGSRLRQRDLRVRLERGCGIRDCAPPHDVSAVLKAWLRELPEPLVPRWLTAGALLDPSAGLQRQVRVLRLASCLMPPRQLNALRMLCLFLAQVAQASDANRMGAANLAVCLGPCLTGGAATPAEAARSARLTALLIEFADEIGAVEADVSAMSAAKTLASAATSLKPADEQQEKPQLQRSMHRAASLGSSLRAALGRAVSRLASRSRSRSPLGRGYAVAAAAAAAAAADSEPSAPSSAPVASAPAEQPSPLFIRFDPARTPLIGGRKRPQTQQCSKHEVPLKALRFTAASGPLPAKVATPPRPPFTTAVAAAAWTPQLQQQQQQTPSCPRRMRRSPRDSLRALRRTGLVKPAASRPDPLRSVRRLWSPLSAAGRLQLLSSSPLRFLGGSSYQLNA